MSASWSYSDREANTGRYALFLGLDGMHKTNAIFLDGRVKRVVRKVHVVI